MLPRQSEGSEVKIDTLVGQLPDVLPSEQGGKYSRDWDDAFKRASARWDVPFALLKAHAIQESSLIKTAIRHEPATRTRPPSASYGLMQLLWWPGSDRFKNYGWSADRIGDASILYDEYVNTDIAAQLIRDNFRTFKTLRDSINAYNTGVKESVRPAPHNYIDRVLGYYEKISNQKIIS